MILITKKQNFHAKYEINTTNNSFTIQSGDYCELPQSEDEIIIKLKFNTYVIKISNEDNAIILIENMNITNRLKILGIKCNLEIYHNKSVLSYLGSAITILAYSFFFLLLFTFPVLYFLMILSN